MLLGTVGLGGRVGMRMSLLQSKPSYAGPVTTPDHRLPARLAVPDANRLDPARPDYQAILAAHGAALEAAEDGYLDPATGGGCFTAAYLWARGTCCDCGCRHCPYVNQAARLG